MRATALIALPFTLPLVLAGCAPKTPPAAAAPLSLDCSEPFEVQRVRLTAQPNLVAAPHESAEPYAFYSTPDGRTSYLITEPSAPAYPAIMMQRAAGTDVTTTGCPYGDRKAYETLVVYLNSLKTWSRR